MDELAASLTHLMATMFMWGLVQEKPEDLDERYSRIKTVINCTNPEHEDFNLIGADSYNQLAEIAKEQDFKNALTAVSGGFIDVLLDLQRRKIGKVLSYAKPGEKVDVLLGSG